jgi:predicted acylesterase/phospholipase RssA
VTVLSSYYNQRRGSDRLKKVRIWEAARATSAATTFFEPIVIDGETFIDGATGANNPINHLWSEASDLWGSGGPLQSKDVGCLVSIGTGVKPGTPNHPDLISVGKMLKAISTDTEATGEMFERHHTDLFRSRRAFRFNVDKGLENVGLEHIQKWTEIQAATRQYVEREAISVQMNECAVWVGAKTSKDSSSTSLLQTLITIDRHSTTCMLCFGHGRRLHRRLAWSEQSRCRRKHRNVYAH